MHPNYCQVTILLVVDLCSSLACFMMTRPLPANCSLVARKLPTNVIMKQELIFYGYGVCTTIIGLYCGTDRLIGYSVGDMSEWVICMCRLGKFFLALMEYCVLSFFAPPLSSLFPDHPHQVTSLNLLV